jgi:transposase
MRVRSTLAKPGLLSIGDCKMASLATRAGVVFNRDFYLCPLSAVQVPSEVLASYVAAVTRGDQTLRPLERVGGDGQTEHIADGFEIAETVTADHDTWPVTWTERRLVVRSVQQARTAEQALHTRLTKAQQALTEVIAHGRGKRRPKDLASMEQAVATIVTRYQVAGLLQVTCRDDGQERQVRAYGGRPARVRHTSVLSVTWEVIPAVLEATVAALGWRVYVTNQGPEQLSLEQAVLAYREEYIVERSLGRLKGHPLSLQPMSLERDDHATGLVRLLSIALRVLTLVESVARRNLAKEGGRVAGL